MALLPRSSPAWCCRPRTFEMCKPINFSLNFLCFLLLTMDWSTICIIIYNKWQDILRTLLLTYAKNMLPFSQNSGSNQVFSFLLVTVYVQRDGSQSQTQSEEENHDGYEPITAIWTLSGDWYGPCHMMSFWATKLRGKFCWVLLGKVFLPNRDNDVVIWMSWIVGIILPPWVNQVNMPRKNAERTYLLTLFEPLRTISTCASLPAPSTALLVAKWLQ